MYRLSKAGGNDRWETIRDPLSTRIRVTTREKTIKGEMLHQRSSTKAEEKQARMSCALGISPQILRAKKFYA